MAKIDKITISITFSTIMDSGFQSMGAALYLRLFSFVFYLYITEVWIINLVQAYRVEPMVTTSFPLKPVLMPHHKGRKRLHLGQFMFSAGSCQYYMGDL